MLRPAVQARYGQRRREAHHVRLAAGNVTAYGQGGKAIVREPGQLRFLIYIAAGGSLTYGDMVKGSTSRSDDFSDAAAAALAGSSHRP